LAASSVRIKTGGPAGLNESFREFLNISLPSVETRAIRHKLVEMLLLQTEEDVRCNFRLGKDVH